mmetsp:Transcript_28547/g.92168  ORF Transcript_28547/g.92168 Transcript_28547/m.92168 type:complete len:209 (+) Transcript_28547:435-1061(+)|eukprot:scaffold12234_cov112-Isochrysis_galbana.AAC.3
MPEPAARRLPIPSFAAAPPPPRCSSSVPRLYLSSTLRPLHLAWYPRAYRKRSRTPAPAAVGRAPCSSTTCSVSSDGAISAHSTVLSSITPRCRHSSSTSADAARPRNRSTTLAPASTAMVSPSRSGLLTTSNQPDVGGSFAIPSSFAYPGRSSSGGGPLRAAAVSCTSSSISAGEQQPQNRRLDGAGGGGGAPRRRPAPGVPESICLL